MASFLPSRLRSHGVLALTRHWRHQSCKSITQRSGMCRTDPVPIRHHSMFQRNTRGKIPPRRKRVESNPRIKPQQRVQQKPGGKDWGEPSFIQNGPVPSFFYIRHNSTILRPQFSGSNAWVGLLSLTGINFVVLKMWNDGSNDEEWMMENFATDLTNFKEGRAYTLGTASISHQDFVHLMGNMFAMWLFGFNTYRVIGSTAFFGLYAAGGVACSATHLLHNVVTGRTKPPLSKEERMKLEELAGRHGVQNLERILSPAALERLKHADKPSLGASGSVMAISAAAAALFPLDRINTRGFYIPLPLAVGMFVLSDLSGLTQEGSHVDHAGHLGGLAMGAAYVTAAWYSKRGSFRILHSLGTNGQLPIVYRYRKMFQRK